MTIDCKYCLALPDNNHDCLKASKSSGTEPSIIADAWESVPVDEAAEKLRAEYMKAVTENKSWVENVEYLLKNCPYTVHMHEGGGPENILFSLIVTFTKMQHRLKEIETEQRYMSSAARPQPPIKGMEDK